tara:strand:+ start:3828 stop:4967 length:1140 start_codon:yes stop_codon:yes gene_type:complete
MKKIGVIGSGITATAVKEFLKNSDQFEEVSIEKADLVITSPGIPPRKWPSVNVEIISDIEFAYRILKRAKKSPKIIGITGTNGKTTIAAGLAHVLGTTAYGNIGRPLISDINALIQDDVVVIELSSFQLYASPTLHCEISVIINIEPDHLDWHESFEAYKNAKFNLVKPINQLCYISESLKEDLQDKNRNMTIIETLEPVKWPQFLGVHNQQNAAIINSIALNLGKTKQDIDQSMAAFKMPRFRCEEIYATNELRIINDSKATNMAATLAAVQSFSGKKLLILAGQPKEAYTNMWLNQMIDHCHPIFACGYLNRHRSVFPEAFQTKIRFFNSLKDGTLAAMEETSAGTILFSPSAASFDEFSNYMERGEAFNTYVFEKI